MGPRFNASQILCKDGCGFYGNVAFDGYCSKCHRLRQSQPENGPAPYNLNVQLPDVPKRRFFKSKDIPEFHGISSMYSAPATVIASKATLIPVHDVKLALENFSSRQFPDRDLRFPHEYIKRLRQSIEEIYELTNRVSDPTVTVETLSTKVRQIYDIVRQNKWTEGQMVDGLDNVQFFVDAAEDCVFRLMYGPIFSAVFAEHEPDDLSLQTRFNHLASLNARSISPYIVANSDAMDKAMQALIEIDSKVTPFDKLCSVLESLRYLNTTKGNSSADELLPALVFALIRSRPPRLQSNYIFISRFSEPSRLLTGHYAYVFTTLSCALNHEINFANLRLVPVMNNISNS
ncbi:hypothetical protein ACOME3_009955 [Neoechinorhynchus agilis]